MAKLKRGRPRKVEDNKITVDVNVIREGFYRPFVNCSNCGLHQYILIEKHLMINHEVCINCGCITLRRVENPANFKPTNYKQ